MERVGGSPCGPIWRLVGTGGGTRRLCQLPGYYPPPPLPGGRPREGVGRNIANKLMTLLMAARPRAGSRPTQHLFRASPPGGEPDGGPATRPQFTPSRVRVPFWILGHAHCLPDHRWSGMKGVNRRELVSPKIQQGLHAGYWTSRDEGISAMFTSAQRFECQIEEIQPSAGKRRE